jgi:small subunit ribosomal protein S9
MAKAKEDPWIRGTGRRKTAVCRVRVKTGTGSITVNRRELTAYFPKAVEQNRVLAPLKAVGCEKSLDIFCSTRGGGISAQSGALALGIARALLRHNAEYEHALREGRFLTRDARQKERKKYGQRGARRSFQFSKR